MDYRSGSLNTYIKMHTCFVWKNNLRGEERERKCANEKNERTTGKMHSESKIK